VTPAAGSDGPLRIALLHSGRGDLAAHHVGELAAALRAAGHEPHTISSGRGRAFDALVQRRGFTESLMLAPAAAGALVGRGFHVAHGFSVPDALAALAWRRLSGRPVVFTCSETLGRETVANRRLRLWSLERAVEGSDALIAPSRESEAAIRRWLALDVPLIEPGDAAAHVRLYRALLGG
jgi:hypothetical protein